MRVVLIAAMTPDRLIGSGGRLPWHNSADLKHFKRTTLGHAVIMGRKTYDSCGNRPLPGRRNIIISRSTSAGGQTPPQPTSDATSTDFVTSLEAALELCRQRNESIAFVVGGAQIYALALPIADEMILTFIHDEGLFGDTHFPPWNAADWTEEVMEADPSLDVRRYLRKR